jgi:integrase/recombinase XerC
MNLTNNLDNTNALITSFIVYLKTEKQYSNNTVSNYQRDLKHYFSFCKKQSLIFINHDSIRSYIYKLKRDLYKSTTISRHLSSIKVFFKYCMVRGFVKTNPCVDLQLPKSDKKLPHIFTHEETEKLFSSTIDNDELSIRDLAMFDLIYSCGLRVSECSAMKMNDISLKERKISIIGKGNKERIVFFGTKTKVNLEKWLKVRENTYNKLLIDTVFISKQKKTISVRTIQTRLKQFCKKRGIYKNVYPHMLRHSFATDMLQASKDLRSVQELLGHKNIATTQIYTHLDFDYLFNEYSQHHPRATKK